MIDFSKPVKYAIPLDGEADLLFMVINYNEVTQRCYIRHINGNLPLPSESLVSINDIINAD